jgi:hypothetical protein
MANLNLPEGVPHRPTNNGLTKAVLMKRQCINRVQIKNVWDFGLRVLHHNVQSLFNKRNELSMVLAAEGRNVNILCLTEHWLSEGQLKVIYIDHFNLVSKYCRTTCLSGGSCIFINNSIRSKEVSWCNKLGSDKVFEISAVELLDFQTILVCIYRSPDSDFCDFLNKLEELIVKVVSKRKRLIMCGDWNVNFLEKSGKLLDLQNLLIMNNLINVIETPRITSHSKSLIDVIIINDTIEDRLVEVLDMGYSDHLAQYVCMKPCHEPNESTMMYNRQFTNLNIDYFQFLICDEKWTETSELQEPNSSFRSFLNTFTHYFNVAFPMKKHKIKKIV